MREIFHSTESPSSIIDVTHHGVVPDGTTLNTAVLQKLIDRVGAEGGNTLYFPPGRYLTGGLVLVSRLHLLLAREATILGSPRLEDYPLYHPPPENFPEGYEGVRSLFFAVDADDLAITGGGLIDGQGAAFGGYPGVRGGLPRIFWFARCRKVNVDGLRLRNSGFWMQHYICCSDVRLSGLEIWNHAGSNSDGIDIDGCTDVVIANCRIDSGDDAICLKAGNGAPTRNVRVTNCFTRTHCNHFKLGTESRGDFQDIFVDGLVMTPSEIRETSPCAQGADWRGACGIALGAVDGGGMENIIVQNVQMEQVRVPFFVRLGDRGRCADGSRHQEGPGKASGIELRNITARGASSRPSYIAGLPDSPVRHFLLDSCRIEVEEDGGSGVGSVQVPECREGYPSWETFGPLPAWAIYARHAVGTTLRDVTLVQAKPNFRSPIVWEACRDWRIERLECR